MTLPDPTHHVTVRSPFRREIHSLLAFDLTHGEIILAVYCALGWTGEIEEILRVAS
jgi:hypothetical protein